MQQRQAHQIMKQADLKDSGYRWIIPITFQPGLNMYRLVDTAFANILYQNSLGYKHQIKGPNYNIWYIHPQQTLYLISIQEQDYFLSRKVKIQVNEYIGGQFQRLKQQNIRKIYANSKKGDTIKLLFYLTIRKKSKLMRKCFTPLKFIGIEKQAEMPILFADYCYKLYQNTSDYKNDKNYQLIILVDNKSLINQLIFNDEVKQICQQFGVKEIKFALFQNHDYMIIETKT